MIKLAVVGAGHMGENHIRVYSRKPGVKVTAICDPDEARGGRLAKEYGATWFADYRKAIPEIDAASIAVPTNLHHRVASAFLSAGKPILLEKPIASTAEEGAELVRISRQKNVPLQIGHVERFNPAVQRLTQELKTPKYLEIHRMGPFKGRGIEVSVVADLMIHDIDLVLDLVNSEIKEVSALGLSAFTKSADIATSRLTFANGVVANLTASRISDQSMRKIRVFESNKYWSLDCECQELVCYRKNPDESWQNKEKPGLADLIIREPIAVEKAETLSLEIDSFLKIVAEGGEPIVTGNDGLAALKVALQINSLITEGKTND
ncbi:MAG: Gfo/Idh/MocA family oxidoreductase [Candidatus Omnitrophica bacterium]|nr:Gfo/Idh/MocA family oxidoreductase [Candidatus Omnitrophota bacterium]